MDGLPVTHALAAIPWGDWQFWIVTGLALGAAFAVIRPMLPSRERKAACPGCGPPGAPAKTQLTVDGERVR